MSRFALEATLVVTKDGVDIEIIPESVTFESGKEALEEFVEWQTSGFKPWTGKGEIKHLSMSIKEVIG